MIFEKVIIENFLGITNPITWNLKNQGLVLIIGENRDSETADSNGSGKSSLFESIVWCCWGKTVRGLSGDAVVNNKTNKDCCVQLFLESDIKVIRYRKHSIGKNNLEVWDEEHNLTLHTTAATQDLLDSILGIDFDTFIRGPMLPQGSFKRFSEMADKELKEVLEQSIQTNIFSKAYELVKNQHFELSNKLKDIEHNYKLDEIIFNSSILDLERYLIEKDNNVKKYKKSVYGYAKDIVTNEIELESIFDNLKVYKSDIDEKINQLEEKLERIDALERNQIEINSKREISLIERLGKIKASQIALTIEVNRLLSKKNGLENLKGETCPTCEQTIQDTHIHSCTWAISEQLNEYEPKLIELTSKIKETEKNLSTSRLKSKKDASYCYSTKELVKEQIKRFKKYKEESVVNQNKLEYLSSLDKKLRSIFISNKVYDNTSYEKIIQEVKKKINIYKKKIGSWKAKITNINYELNHITFWKYGFSHHGLKNFIFESITPFMNQKASEYIRELSDNEISIEFSTKSTLKSGETRDFFSVIVTNKNGAAEYIGNSGGEKARADLAINFVLSDLIAFRSRYPFSQKFLDEPFESIDQAGIEKTLMLLAKMTENCGSIFVITHNEIMQSMFDNVLTVVKKNRIIEVK